MSYDIKIDDGDIFIDTQGDTIVVEGYDKLDQDFQRLMNTARGDNKFDVNEGCGVYDLLGKVIPRDLTETIMGKDIFFGLQHMIDQQASQALKQPLSPQERILTVDGMIIKQISLKEISFDLIITTFRGLQVAFATALK